SNASEVLELIDRQLDFHVQARAYFPYMGNSPVGQSSFRTPPFYSVRGHDMSFHFDQPLTQGDVDRIRAIGHWINQNYFVRLCALLESFGIIPREGDGRLDQSLPGFDDVDIVRRLRNAFAH